MQRVSEDRPWAAEHTPKGGFYSWFFVVVKQAENDLETLWGN